MAVIYNFLDYKDPKRKVRKLLTLGWIFAFVSLIFFASTGLSLCAAVIAIALGIISKVRYRRSGTKLIMASIMFPMLALGANHLLGLTFKMLLNVFLIIG